MSAYLPITFSVHGMVCHSCVNAIKAAFIDVPCVKSVNVSLIDETCSLEYNPVLITIDTIKLTIEDCGFDVYVLDKNNSSYPSQMQTEAKESKSLSSDTIIEVDSASSICKVKINVYGMTCASCVNSIKQSLVKIKGIVGVDVSLVSEFAIVNYNSALIDVDFLIQSIENIGFEAKLDKLYNKTDSFEINIFGMTCSSCVNIIEKELKKLEGLTQINISLSLETAKIQLDTTKCNKRIVFNKIKELGFTAIIKQNVKSAQLDSLNKTREIIKWRKLLTVCVLFSAPVIIIGKIMVRLPLFSTLLNTQILKALSISTILQLCLTIPIQFYVGKGFYAKSYKALNNRNYTMDVLISVGTSLAFFFSLLSIVHAMFSTHIIKPILFFDTCAMLYTFVVFGKYLENLAKSNTSTALSKLINLQPSKANLVEWDHQSNRVINEEKIDVELIQKDDIIKIYPGEKVSIDGTIIEGTSYIDESMITGESLPLNKTVGDYVVGGTINGTGSIFVKTLKVGSETMLSQIVELVQDAQSNSAPIQQFADTVAMYFVPGVLCLGLITFLFWISIITFYKHMLPNTAQIEQMGTFMTALTFCISVVVVSCPCALGLATPTAVMVGTGVGAENGILIKGGDALQNAKEITKILLDKTGTITAGKLKVIDVEVLHKEYTSQKLIQIISSAESFSEHPLARAICRHAKDNMMLSPLECRNFENSVGNGIRCQVIDNNVTKNVIIGKQAWIIQNSFCFPDEFKEAATKHEEKGRTVVYCGISTEIIGFVSLSDYIRDESLATINALKAKGIEVAMVTGDQETTAKHIASQCNISEIYAGVTPQGKKNLVKTFQGQGHCVCMVGDGINDSPALAAANTGISMSGGTEIAMEAARIVLMRDSISDVYVAIDLSQTIFRRIKFNFMWATIYNILAIPLAMGLLLPIGLRLYPITAAAAMAISSVSVVCSSLLLKQYRKPYYNKDSDKIAHNSLNSIFSIAGKLRDRILHRSKIEYSQLDQYEMK